MRVVLLNRDYHPHVGGIEKDVQHLAEGLSGQAQITVLVCREERGPTIRYWRNGAEIVKAASLGRLWSTPISFVYPLLLKRCRAHVYHLHMPHPLGALSYLLARPPGHLVITWHSDIVRQRGVIGFYRILSYLVLKRAKRILVTSPNVLEDSPSLGPFRNKCEVIPYGIPYDVVDNRRNWKAIRERYGPRIVFFLGRLVYYKGLEYLIDAIRKVNDAVLLIGGSGPLEEELRSEAVEKGVEDRVVFLGYIDDDDIGSYFHACDVFVLPSVYKIEAFGQVQLQAMACGKPIVSTDLPTGVPYVNQHRKTGIVVPPKDSEALAEAIQTLLDNPDLAKAYGRNARERARGYFSIENKLAATFRAYKQALKTSEASPQVDDA